MAKLKKINTSKSRNALKKTKSIKKPKAKKAIKKKSPPKKSGVPPAKTCTPQEMKLIKYHLLTLTKEQAAIKAGYSPATAASQATEILKRPRVKKELNKRIKEIVARSDAKIAKVIEHLYICAYYDPADIIDSEGGLVDSMENLKAKNLTYAIMGIETKLNSKGDSYTIIKLANKEKAREQLGKYLQMFTDKVELTGGLTLNIGKPPESGDVENNSTETAEPIEIKV